MTLPMMCIRPMCEKASNKRARFGLAVMVSFQWKVDKVYTYNKETENGTQHRYTRVGEIHIRV